MEYEDMKYLDDFSNTIYKTMSARFTAFRRMKRNRDASRVAETMFSASIIAISLIALLNKNAVFTEEISIFTIILSTFLLVFSQLFNSLNYNKRMENYHDCGNKLNYLYRQIYRDMNYYSEEELKEKYQDYLDQYEQILREFNLNHSLFDYQYTEAMSQDSDVQQFKRLRLLIRYYIFDIYFFYWLLAIVPALGVFFWFIANLS